MANRVISIEIGLQRTKICEVDYKKKNPCVYNWITFTTPEDTFEDGYIRDKVKFASVAKEKIKEANMKGNKVVFTIASTKIANREVTIPMVKDNQIQAVIDANASEYFPVEISEYAITYSILERIITKEEKKLRLSVLAAPNNLIKNYYNVAELLGYEVEAIDYIGNSIVQIFKKQMKAETNLMIQINEQTTLISILEENVLQLQRTIPYGTTSAVQAVLNNECFNVENENEALLLLCSSELINMQLDSYEEEAALTVSESAAEFMDFGKERDGKEEVTNSLSYLISNVLRVLDYYTSKNKDKSIRTIYVMGQGAQILGIERLLRHETGIDTEKLKNLTSVAFHKDTYMNQEEQSEYISCIGATIDPIHFIPKEYISTVKKKSLIHNRKVVLIGSVAISIILILTAYIGYQFERLEKKRLEAQISALSGVYEVYESHALAKEKYDTMKAMYDVTVGYNDELSALIKELEDKLPSDLNVVTMNVTDKDISLNINTDSKTIAAKVLTQLKTIKVLTQVSTTNITETRDEGGNVTVSFTVTAQYQSVPEEDTDGIY
ncbi:type IV pilus assembly protein PilM [Mobilisporobacter senegalensis]|uniref:Type IV pilus assembly protein PilM n=1 Tax=Mobilisporobacter senegalensis TaxID=1329262 RepID=A0A3N1XWH6_9FIRM|nr:pilus assembly protein PilM [Mobilisporobacter senegalensis]ROR30638.1 type IV pilus assembly protein PilM [Mobilisporobacter senegalensis]